MCPQKVVIFSPVATSHKQMDTFFSPPFHQAPETKYSPQGEKCNVIDLWFPSNCGIVITIFPSVASHKTISFHSPPAIISPFGENAIPVSDARYAPPFGGGFKGSSTICLPVSTSHKQAFQSRDLDILASRLPSGLNLNPVGLNLNP